MYNMQLSILSYKVDLEILILIGILIIMFNSFYGCCCCSNGMMEGFKSKARSDSMNYSKKTGKEGFTGANTNYGESSAFNLNVNKPINTSSWMQPSMVITPGKKISKAISNILNRKPQKLPLPEGQLDMFANTQFKPECCPNAFSSSSGCACMTTGQYNYLITRGGNNTPYSEY